MKRSPAYISNRLIAYGLFLIACGLVGYELTAESSQSSIVNGSAAGVLITILGFVYRSGRPWVIPATLSATGIFTVTFLWRTVVQWSQVASGDADHFSVAILLSTMLVTSLLVLRLLIRSR